MADGEPNERVIFAEITNVRVVARVGEHPDGDYAERRERALRILAMRGHRGDVIERRYVEYTCVKCGLTARVEEVAHVDRPGLDGWALRQQCPHRHVP